MDLEFEGQRHGAQADAGVAELEANGDSLIVVLNENATKQPRSATAVARLFSSRLWLDAGHDLVSDSVK
jgi:cell division GTPase FtsZ